ncbi:MAG: ABC transporter ATP-binding protein [Deltaproteobacteria bacterium]|nr:ABC transporter ATP-binding protein [Deltaproteobacteria bacterium]
MIQIQDLHKSFGDNEIIQGISLDINKGEVLALIGGSGKGKSVLLKHVAGLLKPDKGRILINGKDIARLRSGELTQVRRHMGFLFQGGALFDSMTVYDNVAFPLREKTKMNEAEIREKVLDSLAQVGLAGAEDRFPSQISGGMVKRTAFARELVWHPEIMLFDEPTTGLDPIIGNSILNLINDLHKKYLFTGIIVTHEIPRIFDIVDKVAMLHDGVILAEGTPHDIVTSDDPIVQQFIKGEIDGPISYR